MIKNNCMRNSETYGGQGKLNSVYKRTGYFNIWIIDEYTWTSMFDNETYNMIRYIF